MSKHRPLTAVAVGLSALMLSGCAGSASPGVGASVGDETISTSRINDVTQNLCTAFSDQIEAESADVALSEIRQIAVQLMVEGAQAEQIAEDYDVTTSGTYQNAVGESTRAAALMPEDVRQDYIELASTPALVADVEAQVGRAKLMDEGIAEPTEEQAAQAGADVFTTWTGANDIELDPKYGLEVRDGTLTPVDTSLSFAVSDEARAGLANLAAEPDPEATSAYARSLPASQRCGD
ncbi:hypothetical protein [Nocardioides sp.]|uniref:hypothetical protein n=1 Tax=Nocardioides sp. TaxID=35761 RepID=UPI002BCC1480|nr:hypothetical protein [Nocardioides sp.]HXH79058.1 hypothetical protein [Nocardioides sp.]